MHDEKASIMWETDTINVETLGFQAWESQAKEYRTSSEIEIIERMPNVRHIMRNITCATCLIYVNDHVEGLRHRA